jgi:hypothetical protein
MSIILKKEYLMIAAVIGLFILVSMLHEGSSDKTYTAGLFVSYKQADTTTRIRQVNGPEGNVPKKLIKELNN